MEQEKAFEEEAKNVRSLKLIGLHYHDQVLVAIALCLSFGENTRLGLRYI